MTFYVYFYAEQAFLSQVKSMVHAESIDPEKEIEVGAVCIISCAAAIESMANSLLTNYIKFKHFDQLNISSKIEYIAEQNGHSIEWSRRPWQDISEIIRIRNWLSHYKNSTIGLLDSEGGWIKDDFNRIPKIDPHSHLRIANARAYYKSTLLALKELVIFCKGSLGEYEYLETEQYQSTLVG